jgi:hypothetical protein
MWSLALYGVQYEQMFKEDLARMLLSLRLDQALNMRALLN